VNIIKNRVDGGDRFHMDIRLIVILRRVDAEGSPDAQLEILRRVAALAASNELSRSNHVTPSVSEGPGRKGGAEISVVAPSTPPDPSLTLGATAAVHGRFNDAQCRFRAQDDDGLGIP
jgi:hypothetical protein